jgi:hypothetical protein
MMYAMSMVNRVKQEGDFEVDDSANVCSASRPFLYAVTHVCMLI